jgi:hypothetical protein
LWKNKTATDRVSHNFSCFPFQGRK